MSVQVDGRKLTLGTSCWCERVNSRRHCRMSHKNPQNLLGGTGIVSPVKFMLLSLEDIQLFHFHSERCIYDVILIKKSVLPKSAIS